ncbi:creatinine amidohydrolase [Paenibacillus marchantiophytorum]|uniref:Creatinine amidohydrolase n=1 Tax=Paenibacillus marchantiophytorum TaxID=1619310 RepID=A0ABQ1EN33_9BACL|nr:creatininase family protein [Paenibacillus marchantiophytorum]GFZ78743.1 creatinine amidohydrolase [Paenibacillus marchantiophytorum]
MQFDRLNSEEARDVLRGQPVALLSLGAVENHGNHLPLGTDNDLSYGVSKLVEERIDNSILLPPIAYGQVWSTSAYAGTINLSLQTFTNLLVEIGESLFKQGVRIFVMINGHMGNLDAMKIASRKLYDELEMKVFCFTYPGIEEISAEVLEAPRVHKSFFHACELETSYMLYLAPHEVRMDKAKPNYPVIPEDFDLTPTPWHMITDTPVLGDPTYATREKGETIIKFAVDNMVRFIESAQNNKV